MRGLAVGIFAVTILPYFLMGLPEGATPRAKVDLAVHSSVIKLMDADPEDTWKRLGLNDMPPNAYGMWAPPNLGHAIQYLIGIPTVSNSFYRFNGSVLDYKIRTETDEFKFLRLLNEQKCRFLIVANDNRYSDLLKFYFTTAESKSPSANPSIWSKVLSEDTYAPPGLAVIGQVKFNFEAPYNLVKILEVVKN